MSEDILDNELSLDDIFSKARRRGGPGRDTRAVPFKFLDSYTREDKNIFFGRDIETDDIFRKFYSGKLLLVYGKSGTGKSSIINCGLVSRIPSEDIYTINIRSGSRAYSNFVSEIKKFSSDGLTKPLDILEDIYYENSKPVALIFDQFEEIFILSDEEERRRLATELHDILKSRLKINIILVIREEYFANLTEFETFIPGLYGNRVRVERMSRSTAKEVIVKPCKACNVGIEEGLAGQVIEQLLWQSEGLELTWLQILMDKLYRIAMERNSEDPVIKLDDLLTLGRIGNVLSNFLDEQLRLMPNGDLGEAVLKTMISTDGTKKLVKAPDIADSLQTVGHVIDHGQIEEILRQLINVRIITEKDELGFYELRHDAIAGRIYERMTAVEKELIEVKSFLDNSYKIYIQRKVLLTDNDLKYIALHENKLILGEELKEFIKTSKKEAQRARTRRRNISAVAAVALIVVLSVFTLWAFIERGRALEQTKVAEEQKNAALLANKEAESSRQRAIEGENNAKKNESVAVEQKMLADEQKQSAVRANREAESSRRQALEEKNRAVENEKVALAARQEAENAKNEVIKASSQAQFYLYLFNGKELANKSLIMQENVSLRALLALSAYDLVTYGYENYSQDRAAIRYDGEILKALRNALFLFGSDSLASGEIWKTVSKNGKTVYSNRSGQLNVASLEERDPGNLPLLKTEKTLNIPVSSMVRALAFDKGSDRLACGTSDGNVIIIDNPGAAAPAQKVLYNHAGNRVNYLAFIPEKNWLISSSADKTILVWDLAAQTTLKQLLLPEQIMKFVIINGKHLVFANTSGQLLMWHLDDINSEPKVIWSAENRLPIQTLAYSATHKWLVTGSSGSIMIFLIMNPDNIGNLQPEEFTLRHRTVISQMEFSPDNTWLVTGSSDAIMLWDMRDIGTKQVDKFEPVVIDNNRQLFSLGFDEKGRYLFFGDNNRQLHICPLDIKDVYLRLRVKMAGKTLNANEWKYYVKGDLVQPVYK